MRARLHDSAERREQRMETRERLRDFAQDVRYAARGLARTPGFTAVDALILRPLPFRDPSRLMSVSLTTPPSPSQAANDAMIWSYPKYVIFRDAQTAFESLALYTAARLNVTSGEAERVSGETV